MKSLSVPVGVVLLGLLVWFAFRSTFSASMDPDTPHEAATRSAREPGLASDAREVPRDAAVGARPDGSDLGATTRIRGVVVDGHGRPVAGGTVALRVNGRKALRFGDRLATSAVDGEGRFALGAPSEGGAGFLVEYEGADGGSWGRSAVADAHREGALLSVLARETSRVVVRLVDSEGRAILDGRVRRAAAREPWTRLEDGRAAFVVRGLSTGFEGRSDSGLGGIGRLLRPGPGETLDAEVVCDTRVRECVLRISNADALRGHGELVSVSLRTRSPTTHFAFVEGRDVGPYAALCNADLRVGLHFASDVSVYRSLPLDPEEARPARLDVDLGALTTLRVVVRGEDGRPVRGVTIRPEPATEETRTAPGGVVTDDEGVAAFDAIERGDYVLRASLGLIPVELDRERVECRGHEPLDLAVSARGITTADGTFEGLGSLAGSQFFEVSVHEAGRPHSRWSAVVEGDVWRATVPARGGDCRIAARWRRSPVSPVLRLEPGPALEIPLSFREIDVRLTLDGRSMLGATLGIRPRGSKRILRVPVRDTAPARVTVFVPMADAYEAVLFDPVLGLREIAECLTVEPPDDGTLDLAFRSRP